MSYPSNFHAKGRLKPYKMNKTEAAYDERLRYQLLAGDILWYKFGGFRVRLADGAYYKPDFAVLTKDGFLECHEVKGFWREAARVRIKTAAEMYPFKFIAVKALPKKAGGGWEVEIF